MRLIAKRAEKQARRDRPTIDAEGPCSEQRRRQKCILSETSAAAGRKDAKSAEIRHFYAVDTSVMLR